tara:strand:+ start:395 stop:937 length:543 start_codon:yes stop_codon:yes gene_type:complete
MKPISIVPIPLTQKEFFKFGDVIETKDRKHILINGGKCKRYDNLSEVTIDSGIGKSSISIFKAKPYDLPLEVKLLERHPFGSQAFMPLHSNPFLVIVANDTNGKPSAPKVFLTNGIQGINIRKNTWHGVLTPLFTECDFLVIDRIGTESNLEEFVLTQKIMINFIPKKFLIAPQQGNKQG